MILYLTRKEKFTLIMALEDFEQELADGAYHGKGKFKEVDLKDIETLWNTTCKIADKLFR